MSLLACVMAGAPSFGNAARYTTSGFAALIAVSWFSEIALAHRELLLGYELDIEIVICDSVIHRLLHTLAERGILVQEGKPTGGWLQSRIYC